MVGKGLAGEVLVIVVNAIQEAEGAGEVKGLAVGSQGAIKIAVGLGAGFFRSSLKRVERGQELFGGGGLLGGFHISVFGFRVRNIGKVDQG